jgi:hypothetical protein
MRTAGALHAHGKPLPMAIVLHAHGEHAAPEGRDTLTAACPRWRAPLCTHGESNLYAHGDRSARTRRSLCTHTAIALHAQGDRPARTRRSRCTQTEIEPHADGEPPPTETCPNGERSARARQVALHADVESTLHAHGEPLPMAIVLCAHGEHAAPEGEPPPTAACPQLRAPLCTRTAIVLHAHSESTLHAHGGRSARALRSLCTRTAIPLHADGDRAARGRRADPRRQPAPTASALHAQGKVALHAHGESALHTHG